MNAPIASARFFSKENANFLILLVVTLAFRFALAAVVPFTGDEAYFVIWGQHLSLGYYDHTPLIGWLLYLLLYFGDGQILMRLPIIILPALVASGIYLIGRHYEVHKARLMAMLFLITPINLLAVLISTDMPLIVFSFLSGLFLFLAVREQDNLGYYLLSGLCLGLAFFSKYFAVLLGLAYLVYFICARKNAKRWLGFLLLFLMVLPFGAANIYWNYTHDWANILFNVFNRNADAHLSWHTIVLYLAIIVYLATPPVIYYLFKCRQQLMKPPYKEFGVLVASFVVPLLVFLLVSSVQSIGLHWPLSFIPFVFLSLLCCMNAEQIKNCIKFNVWFSGIHVVLLLVLLLLPINAWQNFGFKENKYADLVYFFKHKKIHDYLQNFEGRFVFASPTYAKADMIYYDSGIYSPTFGGGSAHGREGDFLTDYNTMQHKDFLIFYTKLPKAADYAPYFQRTEVKTFIYDGATFYYVLGYDFNLAKYREQVLRHIMNTYWQAPRFLPHTPSFYCLKYFESEGCK